MRQTDLSRPRVTTTADERHVRSAVVRRAEGAVREQAGSRFEQAGNGMDGGRGHRLLERRTRQDAGKPAGEQCLAGARGTHQKQVVPAGGSDLDRAPRAALAAHIAEVQRRAGGSRRGLHRDGWHRLGSIVQVGHDLRERGRGKKAYLLDDAPLREIGCRQYQTLPETCGQQGNGQHAPYRLHTAVKRERADDEQTGEPFGRQDADRGEQAERNRQIVRCAALAHVGRRQVDGDSARGKLEPGMLHGAANPIAALPYRRVREADDRERRETSGHVDFDIDERCVDSDDGRRPQLSKHAATSNANADPTFAASLPRSPGDSRGSICEPGAGLLLHKIAVRTSIIRAL